MVVSLYKKQKKKIVFNHLILRNKKKRGEILSCIQSTISIRNNINSITFSTMVF